jgi:uncharacterized membrane protein YqjE
VSQSTSSSSGIGFCGLLTIVFITLKLLHVIAWSWWLVWLPVYGPAAFFAAFMLALFILAIVTGQWPAKRGRL